MDSVHGSCMRHYKLKVPDTHGNVHWLLSRPILAELDKSLVGQFLRIWAWRRKVSLT